MPGYYDEIDGTWHETEEPGYDPLDSSSGTGNPLANWTYLNGVWTDPSGTPYDMRYLGDVASPGIMSSLRELFSGTSRFGTAGQIAGLAGAGALLNKVLGGGGGGYAGYKGGIPSLVASRQMLPIPTTVTNAQGQTVPRRPGSGGITYFSPMTYAPAPAPAAAATDTTTTTTDTASAGGAAGGLTSLAAGGRFLSGGGDGVSDSIPAKFAETGKPARLADGEFVLDARTVSEIGNGSSKAGARKLYAFMKAVHGARKKAGRGSKSGADKHLKKLLA
jgi:hypothetical protein